MFRVPDMRDFLRGVWEQELWINPFDATQNLDLKKLKVNEGISDEEFKKWK